MKKIRVFQIILLILLSSLSTHAQHAEHSVLALVNQERFSRHQLQYLSFHQDRLTEVAQSLPKKYGHFYSGPFYGEVITKATSLQTAVEMLMVSPKHRDILISRNAKYATVGIFLHNELYYVVIRTYTKP